MPVRRLPPGHPREPLRVQRGAPAELPREDQRAGHRPHRHRQAHLAAKPYELHDPLARPESTAEVRVRVEAARTRQAERYAGTDWRVNADVPGPELAARWPLSGRAASSTTSSARAGSPGVAPPGRTGWPGPSPTCGEDVPGRDSVEVAVRLRAGEPLRRRHCPRRCDEERPVTAPVTPEERLARVALNAIGEPGDPRLARLRRPWAPRSSSTGCAPTPT